MVGVKKINLIELDKVVQLLDISQSDLDSSKLLLDSNQYPNAVSTFQQSVEKTVKALALMNKILKFRELKDRIGHNPSKMYIENTENHLQKAKNLKKNIENFPQLLELPSIRDLEIDAYISEVKSAKEMLEGIYNGDKIFSDDINELEGAISDMNNVIEEAKNKDMEKITKEGVDEFKQAYIENVKAYIRISEAQGNILSEEEKEANLNISDDIVKDITGNLYKNFILIGTTQALNHTLSLLIMPHFYFVRYPDKKNPLEYYNDKNPLIIKFEELLKIQEENLNFHKEYLEIIKKYYKNKIKIEK